MALTKRQKEYAKRRAQGETYAKAYKGAGYSNRQSDKTAERNAYALEHESGETSNKILARIADLQRRAEAGGILKREQRQQLLSDLAMDEDGARADRIRAVDLLNKMSGDYTERVIYEGNAHVSIEQARADAWEALKE